MPTYLRIRGYRVYFWTNESDEPIHFHICKGNPSHDDTKVWITKDRRSSPITRDTFQRQTWLAL